MSDILLEARGIGRRHAETWLLENVNLRVQRGERVVVVGPSGAGKTLLLRALAMLDPLDAGIIYWKSLPVLSAAVPDFRRQAMYLHQKSALFDGSAEDNLRIPFQLKAHRGRAFDKVRAVSLLGQLGRDASFLDKRQRDLSGGESQIVALVRALQLSPTLLLLDEPTSALDPHTTLAAEALIDRWHSEEKDTRAVLWVSHDREQIERVGTRRLALRHGRLE